MELISARNTTSQTSGGDGSPGLFDGLHQHGYWIPLTIAAALAFGLITVQYALFTAAITTSVILIGDHLGEPALRAAGGEGEAPSRRRPCARFG